MGRMVGIAAVAAALAVGVACGISLLTRDVCDGGENEKPAKMCSAGEKYGIVSARGKGTKRDSLLADMSVRPEEIPPEQIPPEQGIHEDVGEDTPRSVYHRFLRGEESLQVREGAWSSGDGRKEWIIQDILTQIREEYLEYSGREEISGIEYAFMDCGDDGLEEMQVRFVGLDIYGPGDDSNLTMVVSYREGRLELLYTCESWARSSTEIDFYGCIHSGGAESAGEYITQEQYIDGNGDVQTVYEVQSLGGWWVSYMVRAAYNAAYGDNAPGISVDNYVINGQEYCVFNGDENIPEHGNFMALCEQEGICFTDREEVERLIGLRREELGIREEWERGKTLEWNPFP